MRICVLKIIRCYNCGYTEECVSTPTHNYKLPSASNPVVFGSGVDFCTKCDKLRQYDGDKCLDELETLIIDFKGFDENGKAQYIPIQIANCKILGV